MEVIGFANKYYTLWSVNVNVHNYENYTTETHNNVYVKNISMDKNVALAKYPNAVFDENLHGIHSDFIYEATEWKNIDTFRFGDLKNTKIESCNDFMYISLYYNALNDGDHRAFVLNYLLNVGGYVLRNNDLLSPQNIAREQEIAEKQKPIRMLIDERKPILFTPTRNVNSHGEIYDRDAAITYIFNNVVLQSYRGYEYYAPVINGCAKQIKNKVIEITDYMVEESEFNSLLIHIKNFKINK